MANSGGNNGNSDRIYFGGAPKSLQMVTTAMKLKDGAPTKKSDDHLRQHIKRQRHYFLDKVCLVSSVQFSPSVVSDSLQPHGLQHTRLSCPLLSSRVCSNSYPLSRWCHPTISSSVVPFSSCLQSFPASGSFQMSQLFTSAGQSIRVSTSTSVLPMNTQDWSPLGWTGWISLQSKGLSRVFSNTTVQKDQFFGTISF